jgi:hypothetical protein
MALADNLLEQKIALTALLEAEYSDQNLRGQLLERLFYIRFLLGELVGSGEGGGITPSTSTTTTTVASSATSVSLLDANTNRKFASFRNDSTAVAYIELGATATTSSVYRLEAQGFLSLDNYTGAISCIWASANGNMRIAEGE